jgi:hypothetical protein
MNTFETNKSFDRINRPPRIEQHYLMKDWSLQPVNRTFSSPLARTCPKRFLKFNLIALAGLADDNSFAHAIS